MTIPDKEIEEVLFERIPDKTKFREFTKALYCPWVNFNIGEFKAIHWLNTPGPIYTTFTDNCGTGQPEALSNVGGDEDYHEIIFKQPFSRQELKEVLSAADMDPFDAYYYDGNVNWNTDRVLEWWNESEKRLDYVLKMYEAELNLPENPHITSYRIGGKTFTGHLYGPARPIPENYKNWLDFYQFGMKFYLEWYIEKIGGCRLELLPLKFDWTRRTPLDELFAEKNKRLAAKNKKRPFVQFLSSLFSGHLTG